MADTPQFLYRIVPTRPEMLVSGPTEREMQVIDAHFAHLQKLAAEGVVVVELLVRYRQPLVYSVSPVRVRLWVSELLAASFALDYVVAGTGGDAVTARTQLAAYDTAARRPRRLTRDEREFLAAFRDGGSGG